MKKPATVAMLAVMVVVALMTMTDIASVFHSPRTPAFAEADGFMTMTDNATVFHSPGTTGGFMTMTDTVKVFHNPSTPAFVKAGGFPRLGKRRISEISSLLFRGSGLYKNHSFFRSMSIFCLQVSLLSPFTKILPLFA